MPSARFSGMPSQPASIGTITRPPPMPSRPLTNPATSPMPMYIDGVASRVEPRRSREPRRMPTDW